MYKLVLNSLTNTQLTNNNNQYYSTFIYDSNNNVGYCCYNFNDGSDNYYLQLVKFNLTDGSILTTYDYTQYNTLIPISAINTINTSPQLALSTTGDLYLIYISNSCINELYNYTTLQPIIFVKLTHNTTTFTTSYYTPMANSDDEINNLSNIIISSENYIFISYLYSSINNNYSRYMRVYIQSNVSTRIIVNAEYSNNFPKFAIDNTNKLLYICDYSTHAYPDTGDKNILHVIKVNYTNFFGTTDTIIINHENTINNQSYQIQNNDIMIDSNGNIYIVFEYYSNINYKQIGLASFDNAGNLLWKKDDTSLSIGTTINLSPSIYIYNNLIAITYYNALPTSHNIALLLLNTSGSVICQTNLINNGINTNYPDMFMLNDSKTIFLTFFSKDTDNKDCIRIVELSKELLPTYYKYIMDSRCNLLKVMTTGTYNTDLFLKSKIYLH